MRLKGIVQNKAPAQDSQRSFKMKVAVQHGKETYDLICEQNETIVNLMDKVKEASGIATRFQKIIYKGKTLDAKATLAQAKMKEGAKLMLIASSTPVQTQVCLVRMSEII